MTEKLAIEGGTPVRESYLPYGRQSVDDADIQAVVDVLKSDWLTTGPKVPEYEKAFAACVDAEFAVAVNSGTAALHAAVHAAGIGPGDEVIVTPMTFAASANCVVYAGARPVFVDVQPDTLNIDPGAIERSVTPRTKAIVTVDYTGHPCDYDEIRKVADDHGLKVIEDAAHALGAVYRGAKIGSFNEFVAFSTHPVKHITTGEGGVVVTDDPDSAERLRHFRNHGITTEHRERQNKGGWLYEMVDLGYNYRLPDVLCALGISQLGKLDSWLVRRRSLAAHYTEALAQIPEVRPLAVRSYVQPAWHLYVVQIDLKRMTVDRATVFRALRAENIGVNVHYIPVHYHPFYRERFGTSENLCPIAEAAYDQLVTLPLFPGMSQADLGDVIRAVHKVVHRYRR